MENLRYVSIDFVAERIFAQMSELDMRKINFQSIFQNWLFRTDLKHFWPLCWATAVLCCTAARLAEKAHQIARSYLERAQLHLTLLQLWLSKTISQWTSTRKTTSKQFFLKKKNCKSFVALFRLNRPKINTIFGTFFCCLSVKFSSKIPGNQRSVRRATAELAQ